MERLGDRSDRRPTRASFSWLAIGSLQYQSKPHCLSGQSALYLKMVLVDGICPLQGKWFPKHQAHLFSKVRKAMQSS